MKEETKICFKCHRELPISMFYKHPQMADGHLNKCKDCAKEDVKKKYIENSADDSYMEKERARGREKYRRLGYKEQQKTAQKISKNMLYPNTKSVRKLMKSTFSKEYEFHHWNYRKLYEVVVLNRKLHKRVHTKIRFDIDKGYYYLGEKPLDTLEKHLELVKSVCEEFGFDYSQVKVLRKQ